MVGGAEDEARCCGFLDRIAQEWTLHAVKAYRVDRGCLPDVPQIPCLDHEARLHGNFPPHVAAYVGDAEGGWLHEVVYTPKLDRLDIDIVSTAGERDPASDLRLRAWLARAMPDCRVRERGFSRLRGDARSCQAVKAQVTLRQILTEEDLDSLDARLLRLRTVAGLMEKESRVASWSIRTATPLLLAAAGVVAWMLVDVVSPLVGVGPARGLRYAFLTTLGAVFLYVGLKAVQLTEMANRVWKRTNEYALLVDERRRRSS